MNVNISRSNVSSYLGLDIRYSVAKLCSSFVRNDEVSNYHEVFQAMSSLSDLQNSLAEHLFFGSKFIPFNLW